MRTAFLARPTAAFGGLASLAIVLTTISGGATESPSPPPRIEVAFALDATGSMGPYIAQARAKIRAIADELSAGNPRPDVRFALVAYRDKGDDFVTRVTPFTRDVESMHQSLEATSAGGGGDTPESVLEGLRDTVTRLAWTPPEDTSVVRLVYLIGDAPPHNYPDSPTEAWITAEARRRRITIHGIVCGSDVAVDPIFETFARHTEGRLFHLADTGVTDRQVAGRSSPSLAAALTSTTKAYSSSVGVSFTGGSTASIPTEPLDAPPIVPSGLVGAHVRWVHDAATWRDVWAAHTSLMPAGARPAPPSVDFDKSSVLVLGGADAGLELEAVYPEGDRRAARVRPAPTAGVRFVLVPSAASR
jgi:hypothetical protein